jgi:hypothetical protein
MLGRSKLGAVKPLRLGCVHHQDVVPRKPICRPTMVVNRHPCQAPR